MKEISRRQFCKYSAVAGGSLLFANEGWPFVHRLLVSLNRTEELPLLTEIPDQSIIFGVSPEGNGFLEAMKTEHFVERNVGIINLFPNSDGFFSSYFIEQSERAIAVDKIISMSWKPYLPEYGYRVPLRYFWKMYKDHVYTGALQLKNLKKPVLFRPLCEMNGGPTWSELNAANPDPNDWVYFWRELYALYQDVKATNVLFVFCPVTTVNTQPIEPYFPGNDVVDVTGLNIYGRYSVYWMNPRRFVTPDLPAANLVGPDLVTLHQLAPDKPFLIGEINSQLERGRAEEVEAIIHYVITHMPRTMAVISFELDRSGEGDILQDLFSYSEQDWQMLSDPTMLKMYKKLLEAPWVNTTDPYQLLQALLDAKNPQF